MRTHYKANEAQGILRTGVSNPHLRASGHAMSTHTPMGVDNPTKPKAAQLGTHLALLFGCAGLNLTLAAGVPSLGLLWKPSGF